MDARGTDGALTLAGTDFVPPAAPAAFYAGEVMHARMKPVPHRFRYAVFTLLIDLDRLGAAGRLSRFFSIGRFNLISFRPGDHGAVPDGHDLAGTARALLAQAGLAQPVKRVLLLCYPRLLGFAFNPISVYFAYGAGEDLIGVIYEVRNTFGERHSYIAPVRAGELSTAGLRQSADKLFYVSPFLDQPMRYHFRLRPPGEGNVALRILETDADGPILAATFHGRSRPVTTRWCLRLSVLMPLMTLKVVAGIHLEALRLWFKGVAFFTRPKAPPAASRDGTFLHTRTNETGGSA